MGVMQRSFVSNIAPAIDTQFQATIKQTIGRIQIKVLTTLLFSFLDFLFLWTTSVEN